MSKLQRLCTAAALALCALAPPAALAAGKVLYLSTAEQYSGGNASNDWNNPCKNESSTLVQGQPYKNANAAQSGRGFVQNSVNAFSAKATGGFINRAGALSTTNQIGRAKDGSTFTNDSTNWEAAKADFSQLGAGDVVVVQTAYQLMDTKKAEFIAQQIKTRKDLTFFLLLDTCSECSFNSDTCTVASSTANLDSILKLAINQANGWNVYGKHLNGSNKPNFTPNTGSPYYSKLNPLNPLKGHTVGTMQCTPKQNVIYSLLSAYPDPSSMPSSSSSWPKLNENSSYGTFVPFWQSNHGKGACLYMATDNNVFDNTTGGITQHNNIAQMVMNMYNGACQVTAEQAGICTGINLSAGERCQLVNAPAGTPASELVVQATADGVCKNQMWKIFRPGSPAPVPTTGWPALLGLSALLPLLARRRRK